jgi:hypothetical protein
MNSVILVTYVAGTLMATATFPDMVECQEARNVVQNQEDVRAVCLYTEAKKPVDPAKISTWCMALRKILNNSEAKLFTR